jgi:hypothetical protein
VVGAAGAAPPARTRVAAATGTRRRGTAVPGPGAAGRGHRGSATRRSTRWSSGWRR